MTNGQTRKTDSSRQAIADILKNGEVEHLEGITLWPMLPPYKPHDSFFYFDEEEFQLGIAKFGGTNEKQVLFTGLSKCRNVCGRPELAIPSPGRLALNGCKRLAVNEEILTWIFDIFENRNELTPEYRHVDWWWENCAVLEHAVYYVSAIGKKIGTWIVVLSTEDPSHADYQEKHMFNINFKKPKDLIAGDGVFSCIEDRVVMVLQGNISYVQADSPIYRHFRYHVGDVAIIYLVTANGVEINQWSTTERYWTASTVKVPLKFIDSTPLCFLHSRFLVVAEVPGSYAIIDSKGQVERCTSELFCFPPGEFDAFVDIDRQKVYISLNGNSCILHCEGEL